MSKNLVICTAGFNSRHSRWNTPAGDFDTAVICADEAAFGSFAGDNADVVLVKGNRFGAVRQYIENSGIEYDYYCLIDGNTAISAKALNNCFEFMASSGIKILHPAISNSGPDSIMHPNPDTEYRFANRIYTKCLFVTGEILQQLFAEIETCRDEFLLPEFFLEKTGIPCCIYDTEQAIVLPGEEVENCGYGGYYPGVGGDIKDTGGNIHTDEGKVLSFKLRNIISFPIIYSLDKAHDLPDLLESLPPGSEIILMETIKSDIKEGVCEIEKAGSHVSAKYYYKEWDYSKARNACKSLASAPVIFSIDSDERLAAFQHTAILKAALDLYKSGFAGLKVRNISTAAVHSAPGNYSCTVTEQVRIFKNIPQLQWRAKCHENIEMSMYECGLAFADSNILIHHTGYDTRPDVLRDKHLNRLKMLISDNEYRGTEGYFEYIVKESINYNYYRQLTKEAK